MTELCRQFGISRKTGYETFNRYKELGLEALSDRSRAAGRYANQLPPQREPLRKLGSDEQALFQLWQRWRHEMPA